MSKKIIIALFAAITLAFGLVACQPKVESNTETTVPDSNGTDSQTTTTTAPAETSTTTTTE